MFLVVFQFTIRRHFSVENLVRSSKYRIYDFSNHFEQATVAHSAFFKMYFQGSHVPLNYFSFKNVMDFFASLGQQLRENPTFLPIGIYISSLQCLIRIEAFRQLLQTSIRFTQQKTFTYFSFHTLNRNWQIYCRFNQLQKVKFLVGGKMHKRVAKF